MRRPACLPPPGAIVALMAVAMTAGATPAAHAAGRTIHVDCASTCPAPDGSAECPYATIQEAINNAADGDTVLVEPCVYGEHISFLGKAITAAGTDPLDPSVVAATVIDGGGGGSVVTFAHGEGAASVLSGFTVRNGGGSPVGAFDHMYGAGILCASASPTISNNTIADNHCPEYGGGISCEGFAAVVRDNTITGNSAGQYGGAIYCLGGGSVTPTISGNAIIGNRAHAAAGIYCAGHDPGFSPTIADNVVRGNYADFYGGGIVCSTSSPTITGNAIIGNGAQWEGGGLYCAYETSPLIGGNTIVGNATVGGGAGIFCFWSRAVITDNVITGNSSHYGAGVFCSSSAATIARNLIAGNHATFYHGDGHGGGLWLVDPQPEGWPGSDVIGNIIQDNEASQRGGGIQCSARAVVTIEGNVITGNRARQGGGISCYDNCSPMITGNTISGNSTPYYGGGIACQQSCSPILANNVIAANTAARGGGMFLTDSCFPTLSGCTVADNAAVQGAGISCLVLSWPTICSSIVWDRMWPLPPWPAVVTYSDTLDLWPGAGNISLPPEFVDPTHGDYHLLATSPALEAGLNECAPPDDIEGDARPSPAGGTSDMGADEWTPRPVCCFSYEPTQPTASAPVQFADCSQDPDGALVSWRWDFGDGETSSAQHPAHQFAAGPAHVCLVVTDDDGRSATCCQDLAIADDVAPVIACPAALEVCAPPGECSAALDLVTCRREPVELVNPGFEEGRAGWVMVVLDPYQQGSFNIPAHSGTGYAMSPSNWKGVSGSAVQELGGLEPGATYVVCAWVLCCSINVEEGTLCDPAAQTAGVTVDVDCDGRDDVTTTIGPSFPPVYLPVCTTFTAAGTCARIKLDSWSVAGGCEWRFNAFDDVTVEKVICEGAPSATDDVSVASLVNDAPASFPLGATPVTWTACDAAGNCAHCTQNVTVRDCQPPAVTCPPDVTAVSTSCQAIAVDIGQAEAGDDCGLASLANDAPEVFSPGVTVVTWTACDAAGNCASDSQEITVVCSPTCEISFAPTSPVAGDAITFHSGAADLDGTVASVNWDFGDGAGSAEDPATHAYAGAGAYQVSVTVTDDQGEQAVCSTQVVVATPCSCDLAVVPWLCAMAPAWAGQRRWGWIAAVNRSGETSCAAVLRVSDHTGAAVFEAPRTLGPSGMVWIPFTYRLQPDQIGSHPWTWEVWPLECSDPTPSNNVCRRMVTVRP
jgi:PKD repeat protein